MTVCCINPANYKPRPDPYRRPGFERVHCAKCGKWLGDHDRVADQAAGEKRQTKIKGKP